MRWLWKATCNFSFSDFMMLVIPGYIFTQRTAKSSFTDHPSISVTWSKIVWHYIPHNLANLVMNILFHIIYDMGNFGSCFSVSEELSISQQHCLPLTYLTPLRTSSKTLILCGIPDPFTAESTLKELLTALILFLPLMLTQWHKHQYQQEAVAATVVAEDNGQQHMKQLRFCSSEEEKASLFQGITQESYWNWKVGITVQLLSDLVYKSNTIAMMFLERK